MSQAVRMSDIARQMGISTVSVSKALAGKPGVSEELRSKVVAVAQEMGYNRLRQTSGVTGNIGVLTMDRHFSENSFYAKLYRALVKKSGDAGYTCVMEFLSEQMKRDGVMPTFLTRRNVDGIIFMGEISRSYVEAAAAAGLPCLTLDFYIPNLEMDHVVRDNIGGGLALTEYLLSKGYRSIGFVGDIHGSYNGLTRYLGYQWAMCRFGFDPRNSWCLEDPEEILRGAGLPAGLPEAFVCATEKLAVDLTEACGRPAGRPPPFALTTIRFLHLEEPKSSPIRWKRSGWRRRRPGRCFAGFGERTAAR